MSDEGRFKLAASFAALLCVFALAYNIAAEYLLPGIESYIERKLYYERVISKKNLSLHRGEYWRGE